MANRIKTITAGRLVLGVVYPAPSPRDGPAERAAKSQASTAARQRLNLKASWRKLELMIATNFDRHDHVLTLTYDDDHLPPTRAEAVKRIKKFLVDLRACRRKREKDLLYIYVTEGLHGDSRLHHHLVINGTGAEDLDTILSLWPYGSQVEVEPVDPMQYEALAKYLTKEPRERGSPNGRRTWVPSLNLRKPKTESDLVPDTLTLGIPAGAIPMASESTRLNEYGIYSYVKYLLPEPTRIYSRSYRGREP